MQFTYNGQTYEGRQDHIKAIDTIVEKCEVVVPPKTVPLPESVETPVKKPDPGKPPKVPKPKKPK